MKKIKAFFIGAAICFAAVCMAGCAQDSGNGNDSGNKGTVETVDIETIQVNKDECTETIESDSNGDLIISLPFGEWEATSKYVSYLNIGKVEINRIAKFVISNGKITSASSITESGKITYKDEQTASEDTYLSSNLYSKKRNGNVIEYSITLDTNNIRTFRLSEDVSEDEKEKINSKTDMELLTSEVSYYFPFELYNYEYSSENENESVKSFAKRNSSSTKFYVESERSKNEFEYNYSNSSKTIYTYRKVE